MAIGTASSIAMNRDLLGPVHATFTPASRSDRGLVRRCHATGSSAGARPDMKRFALCLLVAACAPRDPYAGQPAYPQSPAQQQASMMAAGCAQNERQMTMICTSILNTGKNTNSGWEL